MATMRSIAVLVLPALAAGAALHSETYTSSLIRQEKQVQLTPLGEASMVASMPKAKEESAEHSRPESRPAKTYLKMQKADQLQKGKQPGEVSYCDETYPMGTENSNTCPQGNQIIREEDCRHAAGVLGLTVAPDHEWLVNEDFVNPSPHPKNCFLFNEKVHFNPMESNNTGSWEGTPICERIIYQNGTAEKDSDAACTGDYEPISTWKECEWAHDCQWGAMYCQEPEFANDHYTTQDAPRGCYRSAIGCYGFNKESSAVTGDLTGKTAVCRLKTYKFDPAVAAAAPTGADNSTAL